MSFKVDLTLFSVFGLPTSQCSLLETLRLTPGSRMELGCKSVCGSEPRKFEWLRSSGINGEASTMQSEDYELVVESVGYEDGGTYKCRCLPDGPQCEQSVYSKYDNIERLHEIWLPNQKCVAPGATLINFQWAS